MIFEECHAELKQAMPQYLAGGMSAGDLKHASAPLGIYQQRNDQFMVRVRITGGHLPVRDARTLGTIMVENGVGYAHVTTRQDIQLQDVPAERVLDVLAACSANGLPFRGGGGNTLRNTVVSAASGIAADGLFDVLPCAKSLNDIMFAWDQAFALPRKLKIGFFAAPAEELRAATQDLGFLARIVDGQMGFRVYGGGGMGRDSATGVLLFDFLPVGQVPRCALAMTELFSEHGDRANRNQARIRFIVQRLGADGFRQLFQEYYARQDLAVADFPAWRLDVAGEAAALPSLPPAPEAAGCAAWMARAASPTRFGKDVASVRVFLPGGNLSAEQLVSLAGISEQCGCSFLRLAATQDVLLPLVRRDSLPGVHARLREAFPKTDVLLESFVGHVVTCIGATVCKIGVLDPSPVGAAVASRLDRLFAETPGLDPALRVRALDGIRISGCPNTCSAHAAARIGMQGQKAKIDGVLQPVYKVFARPAGDPLALAEPEAELVRAADVPEWVCRRILADLHP